MATRVSALATRYRATSSAVRCTTLSRPAPNPSLTPDDDPDSGLQGYLDAAPAGIDAVLSGVSGLSVPVSDTDVRSLTTATEPRSNVFRVLDSKVRIPLSHRTRSRPPAAAAGAALTYALVRLVLSPAGLTRRAAAGVGVDTVRFYQGRSLLPPPRREGRVALYGDEHLERLRRIRALQSQGFTLAQIAVVMAMSEVNVKARLHRARRKLASLLEAPEIRSRLSREGRRAIDELRLESGRLRLIEGRGGQKDET